MSLELQAYSDYLIALRKENAAAVNQLATWWENSARFITGEFIRSAYHSVYRRSGVYGFNEVIQIANQPLIAEPLWNVRVDAYVKSVIGERIKIVIDETRRNYINTVKQVIDDFQTKYGSYNKQMKLEEMTTAIQKSLNIEEKWRAKRIAVTESTTAQNYGRFQAGNDAIAAGVNLKKQWIAHRGARPAHDIAHRQIVGANQSFIVDGEPMAYPGDPAGSQANVINCRCDLYHINADRVDMTKEYEKSERALARATKKYANERANL
jgi:hypothetical protein